jgi:hypothetical protein
VLAVKTKLHNQVTDQAFGSRAGIRLTGSEGSEPAAAHTVFSTDVVSEMEEEARSGLKIACPWRITSHAATGS